MEGRQRIPELMVHQGITLPVSDKEPQLFFNKTLDIEIVGKFYFPSAKNTPNVRRKFFGFQFCN